MKAHNTADSGIDQVLTVAELLADDVMRGAELIAGEAGLERPISAVNVMTVPDIDQWVRRHEFLLATGYPLPRTAEGQVQLLRDLNALGLAGLGVKLDRYLPELSATVTDAATELGLPLVVIPEYIWFDDILSRAYSTIVNRQAAALELAEEIHRSFLDITLSGGGLAALAQKLSELLGAAGAVIADAHGSVLTSAGDPAQFVQAGLLTDNLLDISRIGSAGVHQDEATGSRWAVREIRAGNLHHGFVVALAAAGSFGEFSMVAVDQAAIAAALEVTRDLAVGAVERRFSSNALYELISGGDPEFTDSTTRGLGFGWDLDREVVVLVGRREASPRQAQPGKRQARLAGERAIEFWSSAVHSHDGKAAAAGLGSELVAVIGAHADTVATARAIQAEVEQFTQGPCAIGVSRAYPGPDEIPTAYQEARTALRLGHRVSGAGAVTAYGELGLFRLLAQVGDEELDAFADEILGPLLRLNESERTEMFATLEALVEHNMNMAETARYLHYHYNTLRYRLAKLERLLGPFSTSTAVTTQVCVALQIKEMRQHLQPGRP